MDRSAPETSNASTSQPLIEQIRQALLASIKKQSEEATEEERESGGDEPPLAKQEEDTLISADQTGADTLITEVEDRLKHAQVDAVKAATRDTESQTKLREILADKVFLFMERWCAYVALVFFIYVSTKKGDIPSEVMIALLTTTTVSVIGLVGFIVQGLFKTPASPDKNKEK